MTHVVCRLTVKNRDQLRNPTLGNRVWATFTFLGVVLSDSAGVDQISSRLVCLPGPLVHDKTSTVGILQRSDRSNPKGN